VALVFLGYSGSFIQSVAQFPPFFRELGLALRTTALYFSPFLVLQFFFCFPDRSILDRKLPWLRPGLLILTTAAWAIAMVLTFTMHFSFSAFESLSGLLESVGLSGALLATVARVATLAMIVLAVAALLIHIFTARTRADRRRVVIITLGLTGSLLPALVFGVLTALKVPPPDWLGLVSAPFYALFPFASSTQSSGTVYSAFD